MEQGGVGRVLIMVEKAFGGEVRDIEWTTVAHGGGGIGCLVLSGDVIAGDNGGKAVGAFGEVQVRALAIQNLQ